MKYISTRGNTTPVQASEAIVRGMVPQGGLYLPETVPTFSSEDMRAMVGKGYQDLAEQILAKYLGDFDAAEIHEMVHAAYNDVSFDDAAVAPIVKIKEGVYALELWHGPTAAFKDMALQLLPHLLVHSMKKMNVEKEVVILVATSGDTGKAALEGFKDVEGTSIIVFYPDGGVSEAQELQMLTTEGKNTYTFAVKGNFDDCQRAVKEAFANEVLAEAIDAMGCQFSSANSINWGRLLPQIVYYFAAYMQLVEEKAIQFGDEIDFTVPTGNFGNILAGWYARAMGLPIHRLVCAANDNDVLDKFFKTGVYDTNRPFVKTMSPSMDILVSSNLERFLFLMNDEKGADIAQWMTDLKETGKFEVPAALLEKMQAVIGSGAVDEAGTLAIIKEVFGQTGYVLDTHTAVGVGVADQAADGRVMVVDATANPYKFVGAVWEGIKGTKSTLGDLDLMDALSEHTKMPIHRALGTLREKNQRARHSIGVADINNEILRTIEERK